MRASPVTRGCGSRKEGGVYLECGLAAGGSPIEEFLFDPPLRKVPDEWLQPHRNPILFAVDGIWHVVIWVGADYYPSVWDYIEEVRVAGSSRRVSAQFDFSKLTAASRQYFVHGEATTLFAAKLIDTHCPKTGPLSVPGPARLHETDGPGVLCLGFTKYLPAPTPGAYQEVTTEDGCRTRTLPCGHSYTLYTPPPEAAIASEPALFLQLPITGIAMVNKADGSFDEKVEQRVHGAKVEAFRADK